MNHKKWVLRKLLSAGFVLTVFAGTGHAALLKDIRVGEYSDHTRIVFELDAPAKPEMIERRSARRLAVVFAGTSINLVRKIPVEKSAHIQDIQIWERDNRLTALLDFDFDCLADKSFSLTAPPRFVLDVRPAAVDHAAGAASPPSATSESQSNLSRTVSAGGAQSAPEPDKAIAETTTHQAPETLSGEDYEPPLSIDSESEPASSRPPATGSGHQPALQRDGDAASEESAAQIPAPFPDNLHNPPISAAKDQLSATPLESTAKPSDTRPGRLQYYLVVVLVVITIVILMLLFLMLLVRHRWIEDKSHPSPKKHPESAGKT